MTPSTIRNALVTRIARACPGLRVADYLIGVAGAPLTKTLTPNGGGAFAVRWSTRAPIAGRQRTQQRMRRVFEVQLLHSSVLGRGMEQHDAADRDDVRIRRALLDIDAHRNEGVLAQVANTIEYIGSSEPEILSGGGGYLQRSSYQIDYTEDVGDIEE